MSGRSCRDVAERLGLRERLLDAAPAHALAGAEALVAAERVLASVIEAVIGACFLAFGYERTAEAVVEAFGPEIDAALERSVDFKSTLQELLARRGRRGGLRRRRGGRAAPRPSVLGHRADRR